MPRIQIKQEWLSPLTKQQQINELNGEVKCTLAPSPIHGVGVFAIRDVSRGQRLYCIPNLTPRFYTLSFNDLDKLFPYVKELVLARWASVVNGSVFRSPNDDAGLLFFMNHSSDPNYDIVSDTALRDIRAGEEVVEDYRFMENYEKVYPWLKK